MTKIAVISATGTVGSRAVRKLKERGIDPVEISRSGGWPMRNVAMPRLQQVKSAWI
jgi:putative NADH-flavin reductase